MVGARIGFPESSTLIGLSADPKGAQSSSIMIGLVPVPRSGGFIGTKYFKLTISMVNVVISVEISPISRAAFVEELMPIREGIDLKVFCVLIAVIWLYMLCSNPGQG